MLVRLSSICLAVSLLACSAGAQRYHTRTYTEADGLQSSTVHSVVQDPDGCMWFATRAGTASYDGASWTSYGVTDGLESPAQAFLRVDSGGTLWTVGSEPGIKVAHFEENRWVALPMNPTGTQRQSVTSFATASVGGVTHVLVGTSGGELHTWDGQEWTVTDLYEGASFREVAGIAIWSDFVFVASHRTLELFALEELETPGFELRDARTEFASVPDRKVTGVGTAKDGSGLWMVGADWIGRIGEDGFELFAANLDFEFTPEYPRVVVTPDAAGGLYFGNPSRFLYYHPAQGLEALDRSSGLVSGGASDVHIDREGNVWVAGLRGVSKIISRRFASLTSEHGLYADEVTAVLERSNGEIVLGHPGGLTFLGDPIETVELTDSSLHGRVLDLAEDEAGTIWAAANWLGVAEIRKGEPVVWHRLKGADENPISSVHVDPEGRVWVASNHLYQLENGVFTREDLPFPTDALTYIRRLVEGPSGALYVGTYHDGVFRILGDEIVHWPLSNPTVNGGVYTVAETRTGAVWVGAGTGLYQVVDDELVEAGPGEPRVERPVYLIVEDHAGHLWFGTDNGVFLWSDGELEHFTARHGLVGAEANRAGGLLDSQGRVWLGMDRGVSVHRPELEQPRTGLPTVEILSADVGGHVFPLDEPLSLAHDENSVIFQFRTIAFVDEDRVRFRVWLEGFDEWWEPATFHAHQVRYTNLPPGEYRLHVHAIDVEGRESERAVSSPITIRRALWQRPWFAALVLFAGITLVYGLSRFRAQRVYARKLECEVRGRTAELKTSEGATMAEKERLAVTLASIADGVAATDDEGRIVLWNDAAAELMGLSARDARGRSLARVLQLDVGPVLVQGRVVEETVIVGTDHDGARQLAVSGAPIVGMEGQVTGAVFAFRDVTEEKRTEKEIAKTQRLEALGVLAGGIAHDFNNLLTIVLGNLSLLDSAARLDDSSRNLLRDAEGATQRARSLTEQLLTFSRGGAPVRRAASIADVIRETASFALRGSNIRAQIDLPTELWVVEIDEGQISQVVHNLLINARQAMPDGGTVWIRGRNLESGPGFLEPGRYVEIQVQDEGSGVAREYLDRVFDPYFSTKDDGSGLGLTTAHSIIEKHEGRLTLDSEPGQGAMFRIYLPASIKVLRPHRTQITEASNGSGRILVMDDDHNVRVTIQNMVQSLGYDVRGAADGEEALVLYAEARRSGTSFDAVLMDLTVPGGLGGKETMRRLLALDPHANAIVVSGYSNDPVLADHRAYGFRDRLDKPFVLEDLARLLNKALAGGSTEPGSESSLR